MTKHKEIEAILETDELIIVLDESKITSEEIRVRLEDAAETEKIIDTTREKFRPVAFRAQILFFTIVDLATIDPMYQYSLQWFSSLFGNSIEGSHKSSDDIVRIRNLNEYFTLSLYENVCRSLFEKHKTLFSFKLTINIMFGNQKMDATEVRYFLAGPAGDIPEYPNPTEWLGNLEWRETYKQIYMAAKTIPDFAGLDKYLIENSDKFKPIFDSTEPQDVPMPGEWDTKLTSF